MMIPIIIVHVIACILLIGLILIQSGRGGGLVDAFSGVESMLGTKTSAFLTKATTILSTLFFITCLGLAVLSAQQSRSLIRSRAPGAVSAPAGKTQETPAKEPSSGLNSQVEAPVIPDMPQEAAIEEVNMGIQEEAPVEGIPNPEETGQINN